MFVALYNYYVYRDVHIPDRLFFTNDETKSYVTNRSTRFFTFNPDHDLETSILNARDGFPFDDKMPSVVNACVGSLYFKMKNGDVETASLYASNAQYINYAGDLKDNLYYWCASLHNKHPTLYSEFAKEPQVRAAKKPRAGAAKKPRAGK